MAIIKIDVDGVLRNSFQTMCDVYNREFGTNMTVADIRNYDCSISFPLIEKNIGISANEYFFIAMASEVFLGPAYPGAAENIERLANAGHQIEICSYQPTLASQRLTFDFLEREKIYYDGIHFTRNKWMVTGDYIIDDNPEFLEDERENVRKICVRHSFNDSVTNMIKANNFKEAVDLVFRIENPSGK